MFWVQNFIANNLNQIPAHYSEIDEFGIGHLKRNMTIVFNDVYWLCDQVYHQHHNVLVKGMTKKNRNPLLCLTKVEEENTIENNNIQRHHSYKTFCVCWNSLFLYSEKEFLSFFCCCLFWHPQKIDKETPHKKKVINNIISKTFLHSIQHNFHISQRNFVMCLCGVQFIDKENEGKLSFPDLSCFRLFFSFRLLLGNIKILILWVRRKITDILSNKVKPTKSFFGFSFLITKLIYWGDCLLGKL